MEFELELSMAASPAVSYFMVQNRMRVLIEASIYNPGETVRDLMLRLRSDPPFFKEKTVLIDRVTLGERRDASELLEPELDPSGMADASVRFPSVLTLTAEDRDGFVLAECRTNIDVLPFDHWPGISIPESVAAFAVPNAESLVKIRSMASDILKEWGLNPSLEGYQGDRDRVLQMGAAVFKALEQLDINYVNPPVDFEKSGQRIRLPDEVLLSHEGTCIDLAILYASALESFGLNTLICITHGHAFAAFWLEDDVMPDAVVQDPSSLTNQIRNRRMRAVECTLLTSGGRGFEEACTAGLRKLDDADSFICAVDIHRSRSTIRPLPVKRSSDGQWAVDRDPVDGTTKAPENAGEIYQDMEVREQTRLDKWRRDLLDITARNPLINMKTGSKAVPLMASDAASLEDALATGASFAVLPRPQEWDGISAYNQKPFESASYIGSYAASAEDEMSRGRLRTPLSDADLEKTVRSIYRLSIKEMEESGCNSLFFSIGVLRWYDDKNKTTARYAPLILVPAELTKRQKGYSVKRMDDDTVFNVTLLEMLKQEHGLCIPVSDPLPEDGEGVDVDRILQAFRRGICEKEGWEVLDTCALGVFSFSQYVMWKDLGTNFDRLRENTVVDCLYDSKPYPDSDPLSDDADPLGLCLTVPADSSQIRAVRAVSEGRSFVMHGPPGTGKSQTITNMISNELFNGRTVLFVAEKMAALEVVQERLRKIGIADHCLEMHSNKTEKSKVLDQLRRAQNAASGFDEEKLRSLVSSLEDQQHRLDRYVSALHQARPWGLTAFECISRYEACGRNGEEFPVRPDDAKRMSPQSVSRIDQTVREACTAWSLVSDIDCDVLRSVKTRNVAASLSSDAEKATGSVKNTAEKLLEIEKRITAIGLPAIGGDIAAFCDRILSMDPRTASRPELADQIDGLLDSIDSMRSSAAAWSDSRRPSEIEWIGSMIPGAKALLSELAKTDLLDPSGPSSLIDSIEDLAATAVRIKDDMDAVSRVWFDSVYALDRDWPVGPAWNDVGTKGLLGKGKAKKDFMQKTSAVLKDPSVNFKDLASTVNIVSSISGDVGRITAFASSQHDPEPSWRAELERVSDENRKTASALKELNLDPSSFDDIRERCERCKPLLKARDDACAAWKESMSAMASLLGTDDSMGPEACIEFCDELEPFLHRLFDWANWNDSTSRLESVGLGGARKLIESGAEPDDVSDSAMRSVYRTMIDLCRQDSEALRMFSASTFESMIEDFKKLDERYSDYNRRLLRYKLYLNSPRNTDAARGSELYILNQAINSTRMRKSIRTLLGEIPNILPKLCPCFLMSPQSVAQYITMDYPRFDVVIFDESSQITTCKAIGALGRSRTSVIAGDSRQLPPTSFFQKRIENDEETVDIDSFLDDCLSLDIPQTYLEWHYRSRHESLIRFSNSEFYEDRMLTFPSPNDLEARVSMRRVDGTYIRNSRCNPKEASAVVDEIRRRCVDPALRGSSIGVVAFSISQQYCIQDILDNRTSADKEFYDGLSAMPEHLFIKNLETVQGDERDVILFSIGYGPVEDGTVYQNFGPINREGGGRRLNVAVSRARSEMIVFSSMSFTDIKLTPTSNKGLKALRSFLQFAQNRGTFGDRARDVPSDSDSSILSEIADILKEKGYSMHFDVGSSRFKVDAAVVDPDNPSRYILGILSDGESYRESGNTRDREYAREDVLRRLGWNIVRVWSIEWYFRKDKTVETILSELEKLRTHVRDPTNAESATVLDDESTQETEPETEEPEEAPLACADIAPPISGRRRSYTEPHVSGPTCPPQIAVSSIPVIDSTVRLILEKESPASEEHLIRLYCDAVGISRLGQKNRDMLVSKLRRLFEPDIADCFVTYWANPSEKESFDIYHVADDPEQSRRIEHVPLPEIVNAACDTVSLSGSIERKEMIKAVARTLGYKRTGTTINEIIGHAVDLAVTDGTLLLENERYTLP